MYLHWSRSLPVASVAYIISIIIFASSKNICSHSDTGFLLKIIASRKPRQMHRVPIRSFIRFWSPNSCYKASLLLLLPGKITYDLAPFFRMGQRTPESKDRNIAASQSKIVFRWRDSRKEMKEMIPVTTRAIIACQVFVYCLSANGIVVGVISRRL